MEKASCKICGARFESTSIRRTLCDLHTQNQSVESRFWSKVNRKNDDSCWEWLSPFDKKGYGQFSIGKKTFRAHRISWVYTFGPIQEGLFVCHKCDNPRCVNPNHLFLGSHIDNVRDMDRKGRRKNAPSYLDKHGNAKLTNCQVMRIKEFISVGIQQNKLAKFYKVSTGCINHIAKERQWKTLRKISVI